MNNHMCVHTWSNISTHPAPADDARHMTGEETISILIATEVKPKDRAQPVGQLLVVGVAWTVLANLVLLPALLELRERRRRT